MNVQIDIQIEIEISENEKRALKWLEKCLTVAAQMEKLSLIEVSVSIVDNDMMTQLNRKYRGIDSPTDVLSFPLWEPEEVIVEHLGDIVISLPKALEQAAEYGHSLERELGFLAVHGFLHLLGYNHEQEDEEEEMVQKQEKILESIQLTR